MNVTAEQEIRLTNVIAENRELVLNTKDRVEKIIAEYLIESKQPANVSSILKEARERSDDKISNLISELEDTNQLIREGLGKPIDNIRKRLSRL